MIAREKARELERKATARRIAAKLVQHYTAMDEVDIAGIPMQTMHLGWTQYKIRAAVAKIIEQELEG